MHTNAGQVPDVAPDGVSTQSDSVVQCEPCDDGVQCTTDLCDPVWGCIHVADHQLCDDGNACTWDACDENDGCLFDPNKLPCDDGDPCTVEDVCFETECGGVPMDCGQGQECLAGECVCKPDCQDSECGWDGCGGSCGDCPPGWGCVMHNCAEGQAPCPPPAPYGNQVGDYVQPVSFKDCTGLPHSMHDLCPKKASWIFIFSGT